MINSCQFDSVFADEALIEHGNLGPGTYINPSSDALGVHFPWDRSSIRARTGGPGVSTLPDRPSVPLEAHVEE